MNRSCHSFVRLLPLAAFLVGCAGPSAETSTQRPNILLLVADDLAYADLGSFGGDIDTPNLDALAERGIRFSQFHTAPMCAPTRAMLLTGNDNHVAGMGAQGGAPPGLQGVPGYEAHLSDRVVPFPVLLRDAGYHTYSVGKWHLGTDPENTPTAAGFERSYQMLHGAADHFSNTALSQSDSVSKYWDDGAYGEWPEGGYSTEVFTDRMLDFIEEGAADGAPFFAYVAYTSPHWPLQTPEEYRDLYAGRYDMGYDELREMRLASLKDAGIISEEHELPPRFDWIPQWDDLTAEEQRVESRKMELYAAMVDNLDDHIGRLLSFLDRRGMMDNTIVVFMSDNGAAYEDFFAEGGFAAWLQRNYDNTYETMGSPSSYVSYGAPWAEAGSAPYRGHKGYASEGGIVAPMIIAGPGVAGAGSITRTWVGVQDLAPTFLELAGASYPGAHRTPLTQEMTGKTLVPVLSGAADRVHGGSETLALSHRRRAYLQVGDWKIVSDDQYTGDDSFMLFDLQNDPGETTDVSDRHPERRAELLDSLHAFRERVGVVIPPGGD